MRKETWAKFDEIDYLKSVKPGIMPSHRLLEYALLKYRAKGIILDIGGGPGIAAEILRRNGNNSLVYNIDPSKHCLIGIYKNYVPLNMTLKNALENNKIPDGIDCVVACNSLHELALSNKRNDTKNKKIMFDEVNEVLENLKPGGLFIIVDIEYKKKATDKQIKRHIWIAEHTIGHDHPREELLSVHELKKGLKGMSLIETGRRLQTHRYKKHVSKLIWSKLAVFRK